MTTYRGHGYHRVLAWMSGGNTMIDRRATMHLSAKKGGGGIWFVHNRDKASELMFLFARNMG